MMIPRCLASFVFTNAAKQIPIKATKIITTTITIVVVDEDWTGMLAQVAAKKNV